MEAEFSKGLRVNVDKSLTESSNCNVDSQTTGQESLQTMIEKMKEKIHCSISTKAEKMQILTLAPNNWPRKKVSEVFAVSERLVRQARQLESISGVLSKPQPRKGKMLSEGIIQKVKEFYNNNENSRIMPGR